MKLVQVLGTLSGGCWSGLLCSGSVIKLPLLSHTLSQNSMMRMGCVHILILLAVVCKSGAKDKGMCLSSVSKKGCFDKASADCGSKWEEDPSATRLCSERDRFCLFKYSRVHRDCCIKTFCKGSIISSTARIVMSFWSSVMNSVVLISDSKLLLKLINQVHVVWFIRECKGQHEIGLVLAPFSPTKIPSFWPLITWPWFL